MLFNGRCIWHSNQQIGCFSLATWFVVCFIFRFPYCSYFSASVLLVRYAAFTSSVEAGTLYMRVTHVPAAFLTWSQGTGHWECWTWGEGGEEAEHSLRDWGCLRFGWGGKEQGDLMCRLSLAPVVGVCWPWWGPCVSASGKSRVDPQGEHESLPAGVCWCRSMAQEELLALWRLVCETECRE